MGLKEELSSVNIKKRNLETELKLAQNKTDNLGKRLAVIIEVFVKICILFIFKLTCFWLLFICHEWNIFSNHFILTKIILVLLADLCVLFVYSVPCFYVCIFKFAGIEFGN